MKRPAGKAAAERANKALKVEADDGNKKVTEGGHDFSPVTRAQAFVFEKMLPTLHPKVQEAWQDVVARKGERGIINLKNAIRNKVVRGKESEASTTSRRPFRKLGMLPQH